MLFSFATLTTIAAGGHAYLDPGTGSYLLQIILAAGMSGIFLIGLFRKRLAAFFRKITGRGAEAPAQDDGQRDDD